MTKEEFIKNIVDNLTIRKEEGSDITYYDHNGHTVFEYDSEYDTLWVSWTRIWSIFEYEYYMYDTEIQEFINSSVVQSLNLLDVTPSIQCNPFG